jgi:hypothetical protein
MEMRRGVTVLVLCLSTGMAFGEAQGINPVLNESFTFRLGADFLTVDGDLGGDTGDNELPDIDIDTLGIDDNDTSLYFGARWRATERWQFNFNYFGFDNSGDVTKNFKDLDFGDITVDGFVRAQSRLKTDFYVVQAGYALLKSDQAELGLGLGLHIVDFDSRLKVSGQVGDFTGRLGSESTDVLAPLPNILAFGTYAFTPKLSLDASVAYFSLSFNDYDGSLFNGAVNLEYRFNDHIGVGVGYNYVNMNLDIDDDGRTTEYDLSYTGPLVFLSAGF